MSHLAVDSRPLRRRRWLGRTAALVSAIAVAASRQVGASAAPRASGQDLGIVVGDDGGITHKVVADLRMRFPRAQVGGVKGPAARKALVVAVGPAALRSVVAEGGSNPVISIFTSSQVYHSIVDTAGDRRPPMTAIYAEPAPSAQLRLVRMLYKHAVRTTVVLGGRTAFLEAGLRRAAADAKVQLDVDAFELDDSINRILDRANDSPALLLIPDSLIYTSDNLRTVLMTTYRHGQAVIGFSVGLVHAGALATTYSDVEDIGAQLEEVVNRYGGGSPLPEPQFPKYFRTAINEDVARSLNLVVDDTVRNFTHRPPAGRPWTHL